MDDDLPGILAFVEEEVYIEAAASTHARTHEATFYGAPPIYSSEFWGVFCGNMW